MWGGFAIAALIALITLPSAALLNAAINAGGAWSYRLLGAAGWLWLFAGFGALASAIGASSS